MNDHQPITKLHVSTSGDEEDILRAQGFNFINVNLNSGIQPNPAKVLLWFKRECDVMPITRIQVSFNSNMKAGLLNAGFQQISRDLNAGTHGDHVFLWYLRGDADDDVPIVDLKVSVAESQEPDLLKNGYERLGCDLNRKAGGDWVYLWVKRQEPTYIYEITATDDFSHDRSLYEQGYTRVDEDTNRNAKGAFVFLWYRRSKDKSKALSSLDVSSNSQEGFNLQQRGFKQVVKNLNKGTGGSEVFAWSLKEGCQKIQGINLLVNPKARLEYEKGGVEVIEKNLNDGNQGLLMYIAFYAQ